MTRILAAVLAALFGSAALAQYPNKPIRLVVPFPPAGAAELGARIFAQPLGTQLGQPVIIETRPGADGIIASEYVKQAAPDGYTLYYGTATGMSYAPAAKKVPPYNPVSDFTPISMVGMFGFFVFTHASVPAANIGELVAYVRANPASSTTARATAPASSRPGPSRRCRSSTWCISPTRATDRCRSTCSRAASTWPSQRRASRGRRSGTASCGVLATLLPNRSPLLPEAPTLAEAGLAPIPIVPWGAVFGPREAAQGGRRPRRA